MLKGKFDSFNGVLVDSLNLPNNLYQFIDSLKYSLKIWERDKKKIIWLELKQHQFEYVTPACQMGFNVHHAQKDYIMLTKWVDKEILEKTPSFSSHYISCGGVVINDKQEVSIVKESAGLKKNYWSIPGKII